MTPLVQCTLDTVRRLDATVTGALRVARRAYVPMVAVDLLAAVLRAMASVEPSFATSGAVLTPLSHALHVGTLSGDGSALEQLFLDNGPGDGFPPAVGKRAVAAEHEGRWPGLGLFIAQRIAEADGGTPRRGHRNSFASVHGHRPG